MRASNTLCQDFVRVCLSIDVTGALVLLLLPSLHCVSIVTPFVCVFSIVSPVLVCLSIDVTGALVLSLFSPCFWPVSFFLSLFWVFTCTGVSVHRRDRCTCTLLLLEFSPLFFGLFGVFVGFGVFVLFGGLWVCLSADVTGALPPLPPYPCARIPTRGLVHPLFP